MSTISNIRTIWLREMKRFAKAKSRTVSSLALPLVWLVFIGVGFGSSLKLPGVDYVGFLAPGILGMVILFTSIFSGISVLFDRQFGFLKEILVAPVSRKSIVIGKALGGATVAVISAIIMLIISLATGIVPLSLNVFPAIAVMFVTSICFVSIGLTIASKMKSMEGFQVVMSFLIMPVFFLSGALFPLENTPGWMQAVSHIDPLTYGVDALRGLLIGRSLYPAWIDFTVLIGFAVGLTLLGSYMFRKSTS